MAVLIRPFALAVNLTVLASILCLVFDAHAGVRLKDLARLADARENALVGYGLVTGLAGTGDSTRSESTVQSIRNMLLRFNVNVPLSDIRSRNVAAANITATLPPYAAIGDKLDVNVTSMGDARSLLGGTLLLTHLTGPDSNTYALAQGPVSVGGFRYDLNGNVIQKNHPTSGQIPNGATVERAIDTSMIQADGTVQYVLFDPNFGTADRIATAINQEFGAQRARAVNASRIRIGLDLNEQGNIVSFLTQLEGLEVIPDTVARVVVNERTGTVVAGGDVKISPVTISHGDIKVIITTDFLVSQPLLVSSTGDEVRTQIVPDTSIDVLESDPMNVTLEDGASVGDLIAALTKVRATTRDIITVLQGIKRAGALHAELIIQ